MSRVNVAINTANHERLKAISAKTGVPITRLVNDYLANALKAQRSKAA